MKVAEHLISVWIREISNVQEHIKVMKVTNGNYMLSETLKENLLNHHITSYILSNLAQIILSCCLINAESDSGLNI
jgi:hypothetical protein